MEWLEETGRLDPDQWESGLLRLDTSMPYLGATKPKPVGTLQRPQEGRALVWDPRKPLPGLHEGSSDPSRKDRLLLLGKGPDGPAARTILPMEVVKLAGGRKICAEADPQLEVKKALLRSPRSLCDLAVRWASSQVDPKVGVCRLQWEEESQRVLEKWLSENPADVCPLVVGGKGGRGRKNKNRDLPLNEQAMKGMSYVLRHAAGTPECPITEEGWVRWQDLRAHESCQRFGERILWQAIEEDAKDRVVATSDAQGDWWVAAWSGHTQDRVVGPAAIVPSQELPEVLIHGSYRRHTASIQKRGFLRQSRDLHFHDPKSSSGKWRLDLETRVEIDVRQASALGCVFRKTGNGVWLCEAIRKIEAWEDPRPAKAESSDPPQAASSREEPASSSSTARAFNSAALNVRAYWVGSWKPKLDAKPVTEEVARAAHDLGKNLPDNAAGGIEVDTVTGAVSTSGAEACIAPGSPEEDAECDWSAGESDVEVVQAVPASRPFPKSEMKVEGEENALRSDGVETKEEDLPAENSTGGSADAPMWAAGGLEQSKEVEPLVPKAEEIVEGNQPPVRRRRIKFGSAHLHLLKAVADADAHNWASLQSAIGSATSSSQVKSELVERLEHLADLRVQSMVAAEKRAQEHAQRAKHYTEAETQYQSGLNDEMLRLERMNPVGPR